MTRRKIQSLVLAALLINLLALPAAFAGQDISVGYGPIMDPVGYGPIMDPVGFGPIMDPVG